MNTTTLKTHEVRTSLTHEQIQERVDEVDSYDRFSVFTFSLTSEIQAESILTADRLQIVGPDGVYFGRVEDWDDSHVYVNLKD